MTEMTLKNSANHFLAFKLVQFLQDFSAVPGLKSIFERSWQSGEVSGDWRKGNIACIFKKGRKEDPGNY